MLARLLTLMRNSVAAPGQQVFTSSGTFTVPAGVTSICAVCIGVGQSGETPWGSKGAGGAGGTLSYANAISVTPGESLTITICAASTTVTETSIKRSSTVLVAARGGGQTTGQANVGTSFAGGASVGGGGGGAGGYAGAGSAGKASGATSAGTGGSASGGSAYTSYGFGGGGVGLLGQGTSGAASASPGPGKGGSGGADGAVTSPGAYGGGGGGGDESLPVDGGVGGSGAVRIIWGAGRSYPSTNTGDV